MRDWRVRSKLAAILLIPDLDRGASGTLRVVDDASRQREFQQTADQVAFAVKVTTVVHELRTSGRSRSRGSRPATRCCRPAGLSADRQGRPEVTNLRSAASTLTYDDQATKDRYARGIQRLDALRPLRAAFRPRTACPTSRAMTAYSGILDSLIQLGREVTTAVTDRDVLRLGTSTQAISEAKEFTTRADAELQIAAFRGSFPGDLLDQTRASASSGTPRSRPSSRTPTTSASSTTTPYSGPEVDDRRRIQTSAFSFAQRVRRSASTPRSSARTARSRRTSCTRSSPTCWPS